MPWPGDNPRLRELVRRSRWAALAAALVLGWQALTVYANYGGNWTGLFRTGGETRVPARLAAATLRNPHPIGYDGQFYRFLAHDPLLRRDTAAYLDDARVRSRRILIPLLAWLLGAGQDGAIDAAYILIIAGCIAGGVYWLGRVLHRAAPAWEPYWGLVFLLVPAVTTGVDAMTVDIAVAALTAGLLWHLERGAALPVWLILAAAPLVRETGVLLIAGCVITALLRRHWSRAALWMSATVPMLLWYLYLHYQLPPPDPGEPIVPSWTVPHARIGILMSLFHPADYPSLSPPVRTVVGILDAVAILATIAAAIMAVMRLLRARPPEAGPLLGLYACLLLALTSPAFWLFAYGYARVISPLFVLLLATGGADRRWLAGAVAACLLVDLRVSAELFTQLLGVLERLRPG